MEEEKKQEIIYKIIEYDYKDAKSEQDCFDDCLTLLADLKNNLKSVDFIEDWMSKLIYWQMARHKIEHIQVRILENKVVPSEMNNVINFNKELLNSKNLMDFAKFTDTILHEFTHAVTDRNNLNLKKDIDGNTNGKFIQEFSFYINTFLKNNSDLTDETIDDITFGMYFFNESERQSRTQANLQSMELFENAYERSTSFFKKKILAKAVDSVKTIKKEYNPNRFECVNVYNIYKTTLKDISVEYQKNHEIKTDDDFYYLNIARQIYQSDQLDQNSFYKFLLQNKLNYAKEFLDDLTFKNSAKNIEHFKWTLAEHNIDISSIKFNNFKENYLFLLNKEDIKQKSQEKLTLKQEKQVEKEQEKPTQKEVSKEKTKSFDKENISQEEHEKEM